ncbi:tRNA (N6-isopentenyl adenosine(37)-C2)-methylthiotransferase MiaB [Candidatus Falkowbacteria bacterium]|nr:tRNA (N6-isopentenyl adenosine(37)-C2)-methylthiotransferase MiaB [Candidatus Falkowbacteria bacterium]
MQNKTYHIITIGCQMNKSDSERMASFLEDLGYAEVADRKKADLVIINTCGVRQSAEDRIYGLIPRIKKENTSVRVVITGCLSGRPDVQKRLEGVVDFWLPIKDLVKMADFLREAHNLRQRPDDYLKVIPKYHSGISAFVPIGNGCDNFCTYCVVPYARGREVYRPAEEVLDEARNLVRQGFKEIVLIAQNVNSYKSEDEEKIGFGELLRRVNNIPGNFWIRFWTSHPKDMSDDLIAAMSECGKVCHFLHLPVQAGDDEVLSRMNRKYTNAHYRALISKIRAVMPDISISTDIIVGFPGETELQFNNTADLARWSRFDNIYIGQYSPRPYTAAAKFEDDISKEEKKRREDVLTDILRETAAENHSRLVGQVLEVLVESEKKGVVFGRSRDNTAVKVIGGSPNQVGKFVRVVIVEARDFGMDGKLLEDPITRVS